MEQLADIMRREGAICRNVGQGNVLSEIFVDVKKNFLYVGARVAIDLGMNGRARIDFRWIAKRQQHGFYNS